MGCLRTCLKVGGAALHVRFVLGSVCPVCFCEFVARPRAIGHLMRGSLGCVLKWRLGALPELLADQVLAADLAYSAARRSARHSGSLPGVSIAYIQN